MIYIAENVYIKILCKQHKELCIHEGYSMIKGTMLQAVKVI